MITQQSSTPHNFSRFSPATRSRQNGNSLELGRARLTYQGQRDGLPKRAGLSSFLLVRQQILDSGSHHVPTSGTVAEIKDYRKRLLHRFSSFHLSLLPAPYFPAPSIFLSGQPIPQFIRSKSVRDLLPTFGYITSPNSYSQVVLRDTSP
ncbi:hypothetical protein L2E82_14331 [Cichorium intybus]|uniref:Uncharacterized protein n=1 Tax=Cichorium intybus TaxID=13427 RepID=A0ACB9EZD5_CICIN|nr:hypothetical protein L2E82_14331 [Cichorium intybus]